MLKVTVIILSQLNGIKQLTVLWAVTKPLFNILLYKLNWKAHVEIKHVAIVTSNS